MNNIVCAQRFSKALMIGVVAVLSGFIYFATIGNTIDSLDSPKKIFNNKYSMIKPMANTSYKIQVVDIKGMKNKFVDIYYPKIKATIRYHVATNDADDINIESRYRLFK